MSKWFVEPLVVRVNLSDGEWIDLKDEMTIAEANAVAAAASKYVKIDGQISRVLDPLGFYFERAAAFLIGWSATSEKDGKAVPVPFSRDALAALPRRSALYAEILAAVEKHADERRAAPIPGSEEEKNAPSGENDEKSSSVSAAS